MVDLLYGVHGARTRYISSGDARPRFVAYVRLWFWGSFCDYTDARARIVSLDKICAAGSIHRLCALGLQRPRLGLAERDHPHPADRLSGSTDFSWSDWIGLMAGTLDKELEKARFWVSKRVEI